MAVADAAGHGVEPRTMNPELETATLAACAVFYPGFAGFSSRRRDACMSIVGKVIAAATQIARRDAIEACARLAEANGEASGTTVAALIRNLDNDLRSRAEEAPST